MGPDRVVLEREGGDVFGEVDAVGDVLAVEALVFQCLEPRSMTPLVCGDRCRVRTWVKCARAANQRAAATDFMAGPLSVTTAMGTISPVTASTQSEAPRV